MKTCAWCDLPLERRYGESQSKYAKRQTCSHECANKYSTLRRMESVAAAKANLPPPECKRCGRVIPAAVGGRPQYCSDECRMAALRDNATPDDDEPQWPKATGEIDFARGFAKHNVAARDGGFQKQNRPDAQSYVGCSAAWTAQS